MKRFLPLLFFFIIAILMYSCSKQKEFSNDMKQMWDCTTSQKYDSTKLAAKLIGNWKWTESSSFWGKGPIKADKNVVVTFTSSGTFSVTENLTVITQGNWKLAIVDAGMLGLDLDNLSEYLLGRILLCDNQVMFNDSYIDGTDNLFKRIK